MAAPEAGPSAEQRASLPQGSAPAALAVQPAAGGASSDAPAQARTSPITAPSPNDQAAGDAPGRVILRARERAWIQVSSAAGDYVVTRTLEPGEALAVPDRPGLELWTGNAGGLEIVVDGTPVPALAGGGAVRRHVSLDPERLLESAQQAR
jgi:cytoskeleton protein RodZ